MNRLLIISLIQLVLSNVALSQTIYDPELEEGHTVIAPKTTGEAWKSSYMWYPGQLAAYRQNAIKQLSAERCVHVSYPGKFFEMKDKTIFRTHTNLINPIQVHWAAPGMTMFKIDGHVVNATDHRTSVSQGPHTIEIEVTTNGQLPCLIVQGCVQLEDWRNWESSYDGKTWTMAESSDRYRYPNIYPDLAPEKVVTLHPRSLILLKHSTEHIDLPVKMNRKEMLLAGFFHIEMGTLSFYAKGHGTLKVRVGESPEESTDTIVARNEQRDLPSISVPENGGYISLPPRALRYASIESSGEVSISDLKFNATIWPTERKMTFTCNDENVNSLFEMSRATLHSSMHSFYLDGVKRDFLPWAMDAIESTLAGNYLFGDREVARNSISIALTPPHATPSVLGITDYPLHGLYGLDQYVRCFGEPEIVLQYQDRIKDMLELYASLSNEKGFISSEAGKAGFIPGWDTKNGPASKGIAAYAQMMLYGGYQLAAQWAKRYWHNDTMATIYQQRAELLKKNIMACFWDDEQQAFINGLDTKGNPDKRLSHHTQYWAILTGLFPQKNIDHLFSTILPNLPYYYTDVSYERGYEMLAYAKVGKVKEMWTFIQRVFGDWLQQGNSRFPENFTVGGTRDKQLQFYGRPYGLSLCHGANGVPVVVALLHGIIGFSQSADSPNNYIIHPQMLHLQHINATIPVCEGMIRISLNAHGNNTITVPNNCTVTVITPQGKRLTTKGGAINYFNK